MSGFKLKPSEPALDGKTDHLRITFRKELETSELRFGSNGKLISIDLTTGKVDLPEGITYDEAALEFWKAVEEMYPSRHT